MPEHQTTLPHTSSPSPSPTPLAFPQESIFGWSAFFPALHVRLPHPLPTPSHKNIHINSASTTFPVTNLNLSHPKSVFSSFPLSRLFPSLSTPTPMSLSFSTHSSHPRPSNTTDVTMTSLVPIFTTQSSTSVNDPTPFPSPMDTTTITSTSTKPHPALALTALPDELIAMCYADLSAKDLISLEYVSLRLRHLIAHDSVCWKRCTQSRWGHLSSNSVLMPAAATHAGSWKHLYSEKAMADAAHAPWMSLCKSETAAILDIIKGKNTIQPVDMCWPISIDPLPASSPVPSSPPKVQKSLMESSSPVSVISGPPHLSSFSVVLLIDASSSVTDDDFGAMKKFARALVDNLRETHPDACVGVIQFNQHPKVEVSLTNVCKSRLSTSIDSMEQLMGSTDIAAPIRRARQMLSEEAIPGDRAIVLLTDGQTHADELQESEREAGKASEQVGATLYTLGVGRDIDEIGLGRVASGSEGGMHFTLRRMVSSK